MKRSRLRLLDIAILLFVAAAILILVVFPLVSRQLDEANLLPKGWVHSLTHIAQAQTLLMQMFVIGWFTFLGSCFASFLNVVAWRVPRGRTINGSSHCPNCDVRLGMGDNIPVYGWLRNQGQCRSCREPISPRYLIVELILGAITLVIISVEIFKYGWNLPGFPDKPFRIINHLLLDPNPSLFWFAAYHLTLVYLLFTFAVIRNERLKIPLSIFVVGCCFGIGFQFAWPELTAMHYSGKITTGVNGMPRASVDQIATILVGITSGVLSGILVSKLPLFSSADCVSAYELDLAEYLRRESNVPPELNNRAGDFEIAGEEVTDNNEEVVVEISAEDRVSSRRDAESDFGSNPELLGESLNEGSDTLADDSAGETCDDAVVSPTAKSNPPQPYRQVVSILEGAAGFGLVGLFLGWPGVAMCLLVTALLGLISAGLGHKLSLLETLSAKLFVAAISTILAFRMIAEAINNLFGSI